MAVFNVHGMGKQVRFACVDEVVRMLVAEIPRHIETKGEIQVVTRTVRLRENVRARAEIQIIPVEGGPIQIDVYEGYWAPLAEGKSTVKDAIDFLYNAGKAGLSFAKHDYNRLLFGKLRRRDKSTWMFLVFAYLLVVVASFVTVNAGLTALAAKTALFSLGNDRQRYAAEIANVSLALLLPAIVGGITGAFAWPKSRRHRERIKAKKGQGIGEKGFSQTKERSAFWPFVYISFGLVPVPALTVFWNFAVGPWPLQKASESAWLLLPLGLLFGFWAMVATFVRRYVLDYIGDLAIYLSSHESSRFHETRDAIQKSVCDVIRDVYHAREGPEEENASNENPPKDNPFRYPEVYVVAHSLGSVVAYDALNAVFKDDRLDDRRANAAERTKLFLTLGSPLDKTAFIFRGHHAEEAIVREGLAAAVQPMIVDYDDRPQRWVNVWSPDDPISGSLDDYDSADNQFDKCKPGPQKGIENLCDPYADIPLAAHSHYFDNPLLRHVLADAIVGDPGAPERPWHQ